MGFGPLFWFGLDWNWKSSGPIGVLSNFDLPNMYVCRMKYITFVLAKIYQFLKN